MNILKLPPVYSITLVVHINAMILDRRWFHGVVVINITMHMLYKMHYLVHYWISRALLDIQMYYDQGIWNWKFLSMLLLDIGEQVAFNDHLVLQTNRRHTPHDLNQSFNLLRFSDLTKAWQQRHDWIIKDYDMGPLSCCILISLVARHER